MHPTWTQESCGLNLNLCVCVLLVTCGCMISGCQMRMQYVFCAQLTCSLHPVPPLCRFCCCFSQTQLAAQLQVLLAACLAVQVRAAWTGVVGLAHSSLVVLFAIASRL